MEIQGDAGSSASWPIGRLAAASGLPVKTIRFYSDAGLLPPTRTPAGHRRYAPADLARLQLIRSLRALDVDLSTIAQLLDSSSLQQALAGHAQALEVRLAGLQRQLAVARAAADAPPDRTVARLQLLTRLEAADRDRLLDRFWAGVLRQLPEQDAAWFRTAGQPQLPPQPTGEQIDAWLELAELAADPNFGRTSRAQATWFTDHARPDLDLTTWQQQLDAALDLAHQAQTAGVDPTDPSARSAADAYVVAHAHAFGQQPSTAFQRWLHQQHCELTDPRAERWWHLVAQAQAPAAPSHRCHTTVAWLYRALAAAVAAEGLDH